MADGVHALTISIASCAAVISGIIRVHLRKEPHQCDLRHHPPSRTQWGCDVPLVYFMICRASRASYRAPDQVIHQPITSRLVAVASNLCDRSHSQVYGHLPRTHFGFRLCRRGLASTHFPTPGKEGCAGSIRRHYPSSLHEHGWSCGRSVYAHREIKATFHNFCKVTVGVWVVTSHYTTIFLYNI